MNRLTFLKSIIFLPMVTQPAASVETDRDKIAMTMRDKAGDVESADWATMEWTVEDQGDTCVYDLHVRWQGEVDASTLPRPVPPAPTEIQYGLTVRPLGSGNDEERVLTEEHARHAMIEKIVSEFEYGQRYVMSINGGWSVDGYGNDEFGLIGRADPVTVSPTVEDEL